MSILRVRTLDRGENGQRPTQNVTKIENTQNERQKEYIRAVKEVKLDYLFSKPFVCSLGGHKEGITRIVKSPTDNNVIASVSYEGGIHVWDLCARTSIEYIHKKGHTTNAVAFLQDKLMYSYKNNIVLKDINGLTKNSTKTETEFLSKNAVLDIAPGKDDGFFVSTVEGIEVFDKERIKPVATYKSDRQCTRLLWNKQLEWLVYSVESNQVVGYDTRTGSREFAVTAGSEVNAISIDPSQTNHFAAALNSGEIRVYNIAFIKPNPEKAYETSFARVFRGHASPTLDLEYSMNGKHLVTGSLDRTVRVFNNDLYHNQENIYHNRRMLGVNAVCCTNDNNYVISGSVDANLRVWKLDATRSLKVLSHREEESRLAGALLMEKYRDVQELSALKRHKVVPKRLKGEMRNRYHHVQSVKRKERNVREFNGPSG
ncbi:WD repeat and SOF domain-containing protein 1 [Nematocida displodere]|uniref:WD repeat and SOF domain-containing protein 1 n=1 Tax=Nematocida displodere TaxID=1805483 RepID=A0A177EI33_9MICR|nr:WD repeat and SOF domain-containing protein 1 [Nematocida displodere]